MDPQQLKNAVYGGANAALPPAPNAQPGNTGDAVVNAAYAHKYSAPIAAAQSNAMVNESQMRVDEAKKAAAAAEQAKQDLMDPKKYQMIPKSDGGYGFFDPSGNEISAHDYARVLGTTVDKVLANSENPIDIGFKNDYKNLRDYMTAWQNKDTKKIDAIQAAQPALKNIKDPQELIRRFYQAYPTVYGQGGFGGAGTAGQKVGTAMIPSANSDSTDGGYGVGSSSGYN